MTMMTETHYLDTYMYLVTMVSEREHGLLIFVWSDRLSCVFCSPWMMDDANGR